MRIEQEIVDNKKFHEQEVKLRLKFETKLNSMHAIHRELEAKFKKAEKLYEKTFERNKYLESILKQADDNYNNDLTRKLNKALSDFDQNRQDYSAYVNENTHLKSTVNLLKDQIQNLESEKQNKSNMVEEYMSRIKLLEQNCNKLSLANGDILSKLQKAEYELIGLRESKKFKDESKLHFKKEVDKIKKLYDEEIKMHNSTKVELDKFKNLLESLKQDHEDLQNKFEFANRSRNQIEIDLHDEQHLVKELKGDIKEREKKINELRVQLEHEEFNIASLKRDLDNKDIKINSQDKQFNAKVEQLNERIAQFQELLKSERQNKEMWISKFEKEQKQNSDSSNDLLIVTNTIKDKELMIRDLNIKYESLQKTNEFIQQVNSETQEKSNKLYTK